MNTNEIRFQRLLRRGLLLSRLLPWATFSIACGGSSIDEPGRDKGNHDAGGQANHGGDAAGGSAAIGGHADFAGNGGAHAGSGGSAGASGGTGGVAGSGASAGSGGNSGGAGMGVAGSGGHASVCHAAPPQVCAGGPITLPRSCVSDEMASVGTALSIATCQTMCQSMFTFSCSVSAVEQTSITVQCVTGCPLAP